jgi:hypothetical protein
MKQARIHYASIKPISHGAYTAIVELIVNEEVLAFKKTVTDMELIDQYKAGVPIPLVRYVTDFEYEIKR